MADPKATRPEDKTILKTADEVASHVSQEELTPSKEFIPYIVIVDGPRSGTRFQLRDGDNLIGRSVSSVAMLEDQSVSRKHSALTKTSTGWLIRDEGSKNGTFINGQKLKDPVIIGHGDVIKVGIYSLRLIIKEATSEEEMAALPPEPEGKTVMFARQTETKTFAEGSKEGEANAEEAKVKEGGLTGEFDMEGGKQTIEDVEGVDLPEPDELPEKKRHPLWTYLAMGSAVLLVAVSGLGAYLYLSKRKVEPPPPLQTATTPQTIAPEVPQTPKTIPIFLDFASSPLPARVSVEGKDHGIAPVKVNLELAPGKTYKAVGTFSLDELQDSRAVEVTFTVETDSTLIPILFKGAIGIIKVSSLPRDTQLYLEGYYADDPFKAKTSKLTDVVFGKPIYVPYGKYLIELRLPKQIGGSNQFVEDIRFRREVQIAEENPIYEINVTEDDLQKFPAEIRSIPDRADVFVDGQIVGKTPYQGIFPLGEHVMTLRKDGYFEHTQNLKMDINTIYQIEIPLKTTVAGEFVNAGKILMNKGLYKEALQQFSEAFKNSPTASEIAEAQYHLGMCYMHLGDAATSLGYFEQARQNPNYQYQAMLGLASIYGAQKDISKALPLLVEVMLKSQDDEVKRNATAVFKQLSPLRSVMYIYSEPEGASVSVNDKVIEQKTPLILHDLGLGNYKIRIQKDGYVSQDLNISMSIAEFNPVIIKLKPVEE
jgi:pSer/pThr/pTyr-binding forkhead associated (FHA) protein/tetratricopeptide (TPR) repeat protein